MQSSLVPCPRGYYRKPVTLGRHKSRPPPDKAQYFSPVTLQVGRHKSRPPPDKAQYFSDTPGPASDGPQWNQCEMNELNTGVERNWNTDPVALPWLASPWQHTPDVLHEFDDQNIERPVRAPPGLLSPSSHLQQLGPPPGLACPSSDLASAYLEWQTQHLMAMQEYYLGQWLQIAAICVSGAGAQHFQL